MAVLTLLISVWNAFATQRVVDVIPYLSKPITDSDDPLMLMMQEVEKRLEFHCRQWVGLGRFFLISVI